MWQITSNTYIFTAHNMEILKTIPMLCAVKILFFVFTRHLVTARCHSIPDNEADQSDRTGCHGPHWKYPVVAKGDGSPVRTIRRQGRRPVVCGRVLSPFCFPSPLAIILFKSWLSDNCAINTYQYLNSASQHNIIIILQTVYKQCSLTAWC